MKLPLFQKRLSRIMLVAVFSFPLLAAEIDSDVSISLEPLLSACTQCHGEKFEGRQQRMAPRLAGMEAWYMARQLRNFRDGIRGIHPENGYGMQMAFVASMFQSDEEIRRFADIAAGAQAGPIPITVKGNIVRGENYYSSCVTCHGRGGEGNVVLNAPRLAAQSDWYLVSQLRNFMRGRRGTHMEDVNGKVMAEASRLVNSEQMILDIVAYINTFNTKEIVSKF